MPNYNVSVKCLTSTRKVLIVTMCNLYWTFCKCCKKQVGQWNTPAYCNKDKIHKDTCGSLNSQPTDGPCQECLLFCESKTEPCCKFNTSISNHFFRWKKRIRTFNELSRLNFGQKCSKTRNGYTLITV